MAMLFIGGGRKKALKCHVQGPAAPSPSHRPVPRELAKEKLTAPKLLTSPPAVPINPGRLTCWNERYRMSPGLGERGPTASATALLVAELDALLTLTSKVPTAVPFAPGATGGVI